MGWGSVFAQGLASAFKACFPPLRRPKTPWPNFVYDGRELTELEQKTLVAVWIGNAVGVCPSFAAGPATFKVAAEILRARGVLYLARDDEPPDAAPGYAFKSAEAEAVAELIFDRWREREGHTGFDRLNDLFES